MKVTKGTLILVIGVAVGFVASGFEIYVSGWSASNSLRRTYLNSFLIMAFVGAGIMAFGELFRRHKRKQIVTQLK